MSKVSKLKQEAYQASKRRDWDKVVVLYERILELETNNPALINELGDAYLKKGSIPHAIENFLSAAEKYRLTGLLNNAIAIYKKVLRLDPGNLNAHWYLAEARAGQQLAGESVEHALRYLAAGERVSPDYRDAYLKRCVRMLGLYPAQPQVLERLIEVFTFWRLPAESARASLSVACLAFDQGQKEQAQATVAQLLAEHPELAEAPEHDAWRERLGERPRAEAAADHSYDVNTIHLGGAPVPAGDAASDRAGSAAGAAAAAGPRAGHAPEAPGAARDASGSLADSLGLVDLDASGAAAPPPAPGLSLDELTNPGRAAAVAAPGAATGASVPDAAPAAGAGTPPEAPAEADAAGSWVRSGRERLFEAPPPAAAPTPPAGEIPLEDLPTFADLARDLRQGEAAPAAAAPPSPPVDLLAEILADGELGAGQDETAQVSTIVDEIGAQVGGDQAKDPESQYNLGLVYLEMELIDQAADCFASAAMSPEHALRSYEMWGIALVRQERFEEAIDVLGRGLRTTGAQPEDLLGLLYHTGDAYERAGRLGAAREYYERVYQISPQFLDTERRLETLEA